MPDIEGRASKIFVYATRRAHWDRITGDRRNIACARGVAVRIVQRVVSRHHEIGSHLYPAVYDELVLLERSAGLVLVHDLGRRARWQGGRRGSGFGVRIELMDAA